MVKNKAKKFIFVVYVAIAIITSLIVALNISKQYENFVRTENERFCDNIRLIFPILQKKLKPEILAKENVLQILNNALQIPDKQVISELNAEFGKEIRTLVLNKNFVETQSQNLASDTKNTLTKILKDSNVDKSDTRYFGSSEVNIKIARVFENTLAVDDLVNFLNVFPGEFSQKEGLIALGTIFPKNTEKNLINTFSFLKNPLDLTRTNHKSLFLFIPTESFHKKSWIDSAIKKIGFLKNLDLELLSNHTEWEDFPQKKLLELENQIKNQNFGIIKDSNKIYCFIKVLNKTLRKMNLNFGVFSLDLPAKPKATSKLILAFFIFGAGPILSICIWLYIFKPTYWKTTMLKRFVILTFLASLLPIAGLIHLANSKSIYQETEFDIQNAKKNSERLDELEDSDKAFLSEMLLEIKLFHEKCEKMEPFDLKKALKYSEILGKYGITHLFVTEPGGDIKFLQPGFQLVGSKNKRRYSIEIISMLLHHMHKTLKMSSNKPEEPNQLRIGLMIDSFAELLGQKKIHNIAFTRDVLIPFRMPHGSAWAFSHFQRNPNGATARHFFYVMDRAMLQRNQVTQRLEKYHQNNAKIPPLLFYGRNYSVTPTLTPTSYETMGKIQTIHQEIEETETEKDLKIWINNSPIYLSGRNLKNSDWSAISTMPIRARNKVTFSEMIYAITVLYPILIILITSLLFSEFFAKPMEKMKEAVKMITSGNYDTKIEVTSNDEIGELAKSFNEMAQGLREKEFLSRFLSNTAKSAISEGALAQATKIHGTVLFVDIRNFTTISEKHTAEEVVKMLNSYITEMEKVIEANSGSIEKFIGDAIMAVFLPEHGQLHPAIRATKTAINMREKLKDYNSERKTNKEFEIDIGAGISTGELLMGNLGSKSGRKDFTITGITVNKAASMEKLSKNAKSKIVLCSESARFNQETEIKLAKFPAVSSENIVWQVIC